MMRIKTLSTLVVALGLLGSASYCKAVVLGFTNIEVIPTGCRLVSGNIVPVNDGVIDISVVSDPNHDLLYQITRASDNTTAQQLGDGRFVDLKPDNYTISVSDLNTGEVIAAVVVLPKALPLSIMTTLITPVSQTGGSNGSISVDVRGGKGAYTYFLTNLTSNNTLSSTLPTFSNLSAGFYTLTVVSEQGCNSDSVTVQIVQPS